MCLTFGASALIDVLADAHHSCVDDATYGLGRAASSSKAPASCEPAVGGWRKAFLSPKGLWLRPATLSRMLVGGAKSAALKIAKESSPSLEGVGSVFRGAGGGRFFLGCCWRAHAPEAEESGLGPKAEPARGRPKAESARGRPGPGEKVPPLPFGPRKPGPRGPGPRGPPIGPP